MNTLWLRIVDADFHLIADATVRAVTAENRTIKLQVEDGRWGGHYSWRLCNDPCLGEGFRTGNTHDRST
jgi:hypothetical protein